MKNILIALFLGTTLIFGALYMSALKKNHDAKTASVTLEEKVTKLQSTVDSQDRRTTMLKQELDKARTETTAKVQQAAKKSKAAQSTAGTSTDSSSEGTRPGAKFGSAMAGMAEEMQKNPELKEMIKNQQKIALSAMLDKNYNKLFAQLNLTPEQSAKLKDLIVDKQLAAADVGMSMLDPNMTPEKRAELTKQVKAATDAGEAKIKEYLGDANYAQFQEYEKSVPQRTVINGFKAQLGDTAGLSDAQESELLKAMQDEQKNFKFTTDYNDKSKFNGDFTKMFDEEKLNTWFQELGTLNNQYLTRAESILTSDQLTSFKRYLDGQTAMQKMGMQMAAKMFGDKSTK